MNYRKLGRTGLKVSALCLGTMQWGWTADEQTAFAVMDAFAEHGGNFLDTADFYSRWIPGHKGGESEEIIGQWMQSRRNRDNIIVATKVRQPMGPGPNDQGLSRKPITSTSTRCTPTMPKLPSMKHFRRLTTCSEQAKYATWEHPTSPRGGSSKPY